MNNSSAPTRAEMLVPMSSPDLSDAEREAVAAVLQTPNLSMGSRIKAFEASISEYTGASHAIGVSSGTAGLHLCTIAAGVGEGDLVITTPFSFVASANVILYQRAVPIFVDVDPQTGNIDPVQVAAAAADISGGGSHAQRWLPRKGVPEDLRLKAVLPVHVFGQPALLDSLMETARNYDLKVIEDACEALGASHRGRPVGAIGDSGVFAFYPNKQITTGEGGMIVTNDDRAAEMMRALRNQGRAPGDSWLQHTYMGYNYRLDEMSAALGAAQMSRIDELLENRARVASWYLERLDRISGIEPIKLVDSTSRMSWFVFVVRLDPALDRMQTAQALIERGVPVRPYFLPIHLQKYMVDQFDYRAGDFPATEELGRRGLALPFSGVMEERQVDQVCLALADCLKSTT
ncbi:MAG: DegT/DnrJ/EryC1/StrS family aminotransferase [Anaerolineales bacterium]|nr:DegT/DnrJ/EryC1/StrS family aminotransferase [Anaerolineales bacterium]